MLHHRGLCNLAEVQRRAFDIGPGSRVLQFAPLSFDASVWETFMALANGGTLVLARQEVLASGPDLLRLLRDQRVTTDAAASVLAVLEPGDLPHWLLWSLRVRNVPRRSSARTAGPPERSPQELRTQSKDAGSSMPRPHRDHRLRLHDPVRSGPTRD